MSVFLVELGRHSGLFIPFGWFAQVLLLVSSSAKDIPAHKAALEYVRSENTGHGNVLTEGKCLRFSPCIPIDVQRDLHQGNLRQNLKSKK